MSERCVENLIDLNNEDDNNQLQIISANQSKTINSLSGMECHLQTVKEERESLDNNPFDFAQKLANRPDDLFDMVEKEACVKAMYSMQNPHDIKMGKLLSLSDDNILNEDFNSIEEAATEKETQKTCNDMTTMSVNSTMYHTAIVHNLESESPPISMSLKSTPDTCSSAIESEESSPNSVDGYSAKMGKAIENRKRLLKLSIANSTFNSPMSCRARQGDSGFSNIFASAAHFSDHMLATESPLKLVEDDIMTEEPPKLTDAEQNFEADLKMLSIPMLRKLPSPVPEELSMLTKEVEEKTTPPQYTPPDLSDIRDKLRLKRIESSKDRNVLSLIDNLKSLLCGNEIVDEFKKRQANSLLQKLSVALNADKPEDMNSDNVDNSESATSVPQPIVRQGTFDMELQPSANEICENSSGDPATVNESHMTHSLQSSSLSPPKEIPETMLKSSATYESEPISERESLLLPYVETISPITSPQNINTVAVLNEASTSNPDINDIIEQISKLFEQHQISAQTSYCDGKKIGKELAENNGSKTSSICNPTFIVVMPTNNMQSSKQNVSTACDDFIGDINSNFGIRGRSQSLSLHDKVKIVQLPIRSKPSATETDKSPLAVDFLPQNNTATMGIQTPMRSLRRNSFSLGTPHTPLTSLQQGNGVTNTRRLPNTSIQSRYSLGPPKAQERETQHQAVVHPIPRAANLNAFKPDLKRRCKQQTAKTSVMTSKAPLKAVMPIKKMAPLLTATLATPERPVGKIDFQSQKVSMETSMHLLTKSGQISNTSTPMSTARNSEHINGIPHAYSTPAFSTSTSAVRSSVTATKGISRFSNSTPASKLQQPYATSNSALKKRALPELNKAKSPVRMRNSLSGMPAVQAVKGRPSIKLSNVPKAESRLSIRPNMRASYGGYSASTNKENKKP